MEEITKNLDNINLENNDLSKETVAVNDQQLLSQLITPTADDNDDDDVQHNLVSVSSRPPSSCSAISSIAGEYISQLFYDKQSMNNYCNESNNFNVNAGGNEYNVNNNSNDNSILVQGEYEQNLSEIDYERPATALSTHSHSSHIGYNEQSNSSIHNSINDLSSMQTFQRITTPTIQQTDVYHSQQQQQHYEQMMSNSAPGTPSPGTPLPQLSRSPSVCSVASSIVEFNQTDPSHLLQTNSTESYMNRSLPNYSTMAGQQQPQQQVNYSNYFNPISSMNFHQQPQPVNNYSNPNMSYYNTANAYGSQFTRPQAQFPYGGAGGAGTGVVPGYYNNNYPQNYYNANSNYNSMSNHRFPSQPVHIQPMISPGAAAYPPQPSGGFGQMPPAPQHMMQPDYQDWFNKYSQWWYRMYYNRQKREGRHQRLTPLFYTTTHSNVSFGCNNTLIIISGSTVKIHEIDSSLIDLGNQVRVTTWPGPLIRGETNKQEILEYIKIAENSDTRYSVISADNSSTAMLNDESEHYYLNQKKQIWRLLLMLIKQNGIVSGSDLAEFLISNNKSEFDFDDEGSEVAKFREHLLYGQMKTALDFASRKSLWNHAFALTNLQYLLNLKENLIKNVPTNLIQLIQRLLSSEVKTSDPIFTLYNHLIKRIESNYLSGVNKNDYQRLPISNLKQFVILLANDCDVNYSTMVNTDLLKSVVSLKANENYHLLKRETLDGLIEYGSPFTEELTFLNEILEYGRINQQIVYELIPFKLILITKLFDYGLIEQANKYISVIKNTYKAFKIYYDDNDYNLINKNNQEKSSKLPNWSLILSIVSDMESRISGYYVQSIYEGRSDVDDCDAGGQVDDGDNVDNAIDDDDEHDNDDNDAISNVINDSSAHQSSAGIEVNDNDDDNDSDGSDLILPVKDGVREIMINDGIGTKVFCGAPVRLLTKSEKKQHYAMFGRPEKKTTTINVASNSLPKIPEPELKTAMTMKNSSSLEKEKQPVNKETTVDKFNFQSKNSSAFQQVQPKANFFVPTINYDSNEQPSFVSSNPAPEQQQQSEQIEDTMSSEINEQQQYQNIEKNVHNYEPSENMYDNNRTTNLNILNQPNLVFNSTRRDFSTSPVFTAPVSPIAPIKENRNEIKTSKIDSFNNNNKDNNQQANLIANTSTNTTTTKQQTTNERKTDGKPGFLASIYSKFIPSGPPQAKLPDDSKPDIIWDENLKRWVDKNASESEQELQNGIANGPPKMPFYAQSNQPPLLQPMQQQQQQQEQMFKPTNFSFNDPTKFAFNSTKPATSHLQFNRSKQKRYVDIFQQQKQTS